MSALSPDNANCPLLAKAPPLRVTPAIPVTMTPSGVVMSPVAALMVVPAGNAVLLTSIRRVGTAEVSTLATRWLGMKLGCCATWLSKSPSIAEDVFSAVDDVPVGVTRLTDAVNADAGAWLFPAERLPVPKA